MTALNQAALSAMTSEQLITLITTMAAQPAKRLSYKVGEKGGISIYGLGRFPVTAYASQWERIIADVDNLKAFMVANEALLTRK